MQAKNHAAVRVLVFRMQAGTGGMTPAIAPEPCCRLAERASSAPAQMMNLVTINQKLCPATGIDNKSLHTYEC